MQAVLIILIGLLVGAVSFVSASQRKYFDKRFNKWWQKPTKKFWWITSLNIGILVLSVLQFNLNNRAIKEEKALAAKDAVIRDSTLRAQYDSSLLQMKYKFDSTHNITSMIISENLGKYGYKLDSTGSKIEKIVRDSAKTKIIEPYDPVLLIRAIEKIFEKDYENHFQIWFSSLSAGSTNFNVKSHVILMDSISNLMHFVRTEIQLTEDIKIDPSITIMKPISAPSSQLFNRVCIYLIGDYTNIDGSKKYNIDALYYFNLQGENFGFYTGETKKRAFALIPKK